LFQSDARGIERCGRERERDEMVVPLGKRRSSRFGRKGEITGQLVPIKYERARLFVLVHHTIHIKIFLYF